MMHGALQEIMSNFPNRQPLPMETFEIRSNACSLFIHNAFRHTGFVLFIVDHIEIDIGYILIWNEFRSQIE